MRFSVFLFLVVLSVSSAFASYTTVELIEDGPGLDHATVYLGSGEIVKIDTNDSASIQLLREALASSSKIAITKISSNSETPDFISSVKIIEKNLSESTRKEMFSNRRFAQLRFSGNDPLENGNLSTLASYDKAQTIMNEMNRETRDESQCFNRAHMWTYETLVNSKVNLGKVWIFFTKKYIREFDYKWWFHVAPFANVADQNAMYVLDKGFTTVPYNLENWKNLFMKNKASCPVVRNYLDYSNNQEAEHCYLMTSNQYYWQPYQLKNLGISSSPTWGYKKSNLNIAYEDALITWDRTIPELAGSTEDREEEVEEGAESYEELMSRLRLERRERERRERERLEENLERERIAERRERAERLERRERVRRERRAREIREEEERLERERSRFYPEMQINFRKDYKVIDSNNLKALVIGLVGTDRAMIEYERSGAKSVVELAELAAEVKKFHSFERGSQVITENDRTGKLKHLYSNGLAVIDFDNSNGRRYIKITKKMGYQVSKMNGLRTRAKVIVKASGASGNIKRIFSNSKVLFDQDDYSSHRIMSIEDFTYEVRSLGNFKVGTYVESKGRTGKVTKVFSSGQVQIDLDARGRDEIIVYSKHVGYQVRSMNGVSKGNKVVYGRHLAEVERVFSSGKVLIDFDERRRDDRVVLISEVEILR